MQLNDILSQIEKKFHIMLSGMNISDKRKRHLDGCVEMAYDLAVKYNMDPYKSVLAALIHDYHRELDNFEILELAENLKLSISDFELKFPRVLHGKVAASYFLEKGYIDDPDIIEAVKHHTLGKAGTGNLAKLLFVVDALEKFRSYEGVESLRKDIENKSLDEAYVLVLKRTILDMVNKNKILAPDTIGAYNYMMEVD